MKSISESLEDNGPQYRPLTNCECCNESMCVQYGSGRKICHACERYNIAFNEGIDSSIDLMKQMGLVGTYEALKHLKRRTE